MDDVIDLIQESTAVDENFNVVGVETSTQVFCQVRSVSRSEFYAVGQQGLQPAFVFEIFAGDYSGQRLVRYRGKLYAIYRTYNRMDDRVELYAEEKAGVANV